MSIVLTELQVEKFTEFLVGTCRNFSDGYLAINMGNLSLSEDDLSDETIDAICDKIFLCDSCSWWCDIDEKQNLNDEEICEECYSGQ